MRARSAVHDLQHERSGQVLYHTLHHTSSAVHCVHAQLSACMAYCDVLCLGPPLQCLATFTSGSMATNMFLALFLGKTILPGVTVNNGKVNGDY